MKRIAVKRTNCSYCGAPSLSEIAERNDRIKSELARMRPVLRAARRVVWYDWSENDSDAVAAIETLRRAVNALKLP